MMKNYNKSLLALALTSALCLTACGDGKDGVDGADGTNGQNGQDGQDGLNAGDVVTTAYKAGDVNINIDTNGSILAGNGTFALKFTATAKNQAGADKPLTGLNQIRLYSATAMTNTTADGPAIYWQSNGSLYCTLTGLSGTSNACTLVEDANNPGTYTGSWTYDGAPSIMNASDDLAAPHRIMVRAYNVTDATGNAISDKILETLTYQPSTGTVDIASGKDTVPDAVCQNCHGESAATGKIANISAHSNYESVENCIQCHNPARQPNATQAEEGYVFDMPAMIHRIHGGEHLAALSIYGFKQAEEWAEIGYPAPLNECTVCHSTEEGKTTWKDEPTRAACTGCHSNIDFTTGQGHADFNLAQADDSQCASCHGTGGLAPDNAHRVGERKELASLVQINFTGASVDSGTLTVTADVMVNGALSSDLSVLGVKSTLMGNVDANGVVHRWGSRPALTAGTFTGTGKLVLTRAVTTAEATGSIYVGTEATFCVDTNLKAASCDATAARAYGNPVEVVHGSPVFSTAIGVTAATKFFSLDGSTVTPARFAVPSRITVAEAKCEACHNSLDVTKGAGHGVYTFDQCMDCHNNDYAGSYHPNAWYKDANGNQAVKNITPFANRDLVTVVHRYHSGNFDTVEGVHTATNSRTNEQEVVGYPGVQGDCTACHKDGATLFAADGGLTSGKRSIAVNGGYISPVAESCRSCHTSEAALAHFKSQGSTTAADTPDSSAILPVESCATCHAEGKTYGIDKVHAEVAH
ncbi:OmcA/MtrC family decaheme c-type cytochrome [Shewanella sp. GD03713]|uniref:OmcA/MtrC family decaheme c-type cytochrome n=1 Tax=Shewanella sp. GD03713 TaxID=2975372 RepID=UPI000B34A1C1|nr:OmcA/MtrC family decaheme c-type cytochrome [Shewanella sp. GD03713]MDH1471072.1 OmcA/MtrC family decaheme c-type cytochrome [Shewanella sp. GD03713]QXN26284.1 OmcA/MtrC family decaheme c-type cytochrome [Shewanella putrefaciens]VEE60684.1 decaheme c-type cytochrome, OmcA/MtrC family [Shewanella putrefaciens]